MKVRVKGQKKEFDQLLKDTWPSKGMDEDFIVSVIQNDVCFDIRLDHIVNSREEVAVALRDLFAVNKEGNIVAIFGYTSLYMLSPFTFPSSTTISKISPIIASKLHLLPFPPRYLPYETMEPLKHPIDIFINSSNLYNIKDKLKYNFMMLLMVLGYKTDAGIWQMTTEFVEGPRGNPFLSEKWLWEGIVDLLKRYERKEKENDEEDDEEQWAECESDIESVKSINIKISSEKNGSNFKDEKKNKNLLDGWEVVYERIGYNDKLQIVKSIPTPSFSPSSSKKFNNSKTFNDNPIIEEDRQKRLWLFMKIFREVILLKDLK